MPTRLLPDKMPADTRPTDEGLAGAPGPVDAGMDPRLLEYLDHKAYCHRRHKLGGECTCGLATLLISER